MFRYEQSLPVIKGGFPGEVEVPRAVIDRESAARLMGEERLVEHEKIAKTMGSFATVDSPVEVIYEDFEPPAVHRYGLDEREHNR